mgnify:CR=1 FL=1
MAFKMKYKGLKGVVDQLRKASKIHKKQAEIVNDHIEDMEGPLKKKSKVKGGGTKKVCLPAAKVRSMSKAERAKVVRAKRKAAKGGGYKRSRKSFVKGARKKGATLRDWFKKENWVQVGNPSKKCGEK